MAILSKKKGYSGSHRWTKLSDTIFGDGLKSGLNKKAPLHSSDYIYVSADDDGDDKEVGINKNYGSIHDMEWHDMLKDYSPRDSGRFDQREVIDWPEYESIKNFLGIGG